MWWGRREERILDAVSNRRFGGEGGDDQRKKTTRKGERGRARNVPREPQVVEEGNTNFFCFFSFVFGVLVSHPSSRLVA